MRHLSTKFRIFYEDNFILKIWIRVYCINRRAKRSMCAKCQWIIVLNLLEDPPRVGDPFHTREDNTVLASRIILNDIAARCTLFA